MDISGKTKLTALLGHPVEHSISPAMHNMAFSLLGLDYVYLAFDVLKEELKEAVQGLKSCNIAGFNLTMPHKEAVLEYVDELTLGAKLCGAANTVINRDGRLTGHTTDGIGYMRSLEDADIDIIGKKMTILGAGGAAKAIISQAAMDGVKEIDIFVRERSVGKAEEFAKRVNENTECKVGVFDIADKKCLLDSLEESSILTNATNVGMEPDVDGALFTEFSEVKKDLVVSDIIYHPGQTKMLKCAAESGLKTVNGLYMLLYQGAAAFECWTGKKMPVQPVKERYFAS